MGILKLAWLIGQTSGAPPAAMTRRASVSVPEPMEPSPRAKALRLPSPETPGLAVPDMKSFSSLAGLGTMSAGRMGFIGPPVRKLEGILGEPEKI
jgi:hypothetical protein